MYMYDKPNEDGQVAISPNGHYAMYVVDREEKDYPNSTIPRYEIVNLTTLAMEGRVSNAYMALTIMTEFDERVESIVNGDAEKEEPAGIPFDMNLGPSLN